MKKDHWRIILAIIAGMVFMFVWHRLTDGGEIPESLAYSISFSGLFPVLWMFGLSSSSAGIRPKRDRIFVLVIVGILTVATFLLYYLGTDKGPLKSLLFSLTMPVVAFAVAWVIYLIARKRAPERHIDKASKEQQ
jgi:drug/metabolite transporter (DMT)-like permease